MSTHSPASIDLTLPADARIAIVAARFNDHIVGRLLDGCVARLNDMGVNESRLTIERVPGAFEIPLAAQALARTRRFGAIICLGCVVRGDTPHFEYVAGAAATGVSRIALDESLPVIFGILTTETEQQALDRAGGAHSHAGKNAADAAAEMIALLRRVKLS